MFEKITETASRKKALDFLNTIFKGDQHAKEFP